MSKWDKEYLTLCKKILSEELEDYPAPELWLNPEVKELKDIKVLKYKHHGPIKFPIAQ